MFNKLNEERGAAHVPFLPIAENALGFIGDATFTQLIGNYALE